MADLEVVCRGGMEQGMEIAKQDRIVGEGRGVLGMISTQLIPIDRLLSVHINPTDLHTVASRNQRLVPVNLAQLAIQPAATIVLESPRVVNRLQMPPRAALGSKIPTKPETPLLMRT